LRIGKETFLLKMNQMAINRDREYARQLLEQEIKDRKEKERSWEDWRARQNAKKAAEKKVPSHEVLRAVRLAIETNALVEKLATEEQMKAEQEKRDARIASAFAIQEEKRRKEEKESMALALQYAEEERIRAEQEERDGEYAAWVANGFN
jgi:hypothetical protein